MWLPRVTVAAVVEQDERFLLVEERIEGKVMLNQPAGHLEDNESLLDAAIRETLEETGWHFIPSALIGVYRWRHPQTSDTYIRFAFTGSISEHDESITLDEGIIGPVWLSIEEIKKRKEQHRSPQLQLCIDDYLQGKRYPLESLINVP